jgi:molecular chaperone GrpE (heat shock protein)
VPAISDEDAGMVAHLVQIGFAMDDLLLRPAQVLVYSEGN